MHTDTPNIQPQQHVEIACHGGGVTVRALTPDELADIVREHAAAFVSIIAVFQEGRSILQALPRILQSAPGLISRVISIAADDTEAPARLSFFSKLQAILAVDQLTFVDDQARQHFSATLAQLVTTLPASSSGVH